MTTTATVDVVVVGAGAAGITDARDLSLQGYSVTPLEARDRIGERTYTTAGVDGDLQLLPYERDCLGGALGGLICSAEKHGIVQLLQSAATYFGQFSFLMETAGQFSPSSSTRALFDAMMTEPSAKLRLNTAVASIDNQGSQVVLTTRGGDQVTARRAIVAVPLNTMRDMTITPELPALARTMIDQGNPSCLSRCGRASGASLSPSQPPPREACLLRGAD